MDIEKLTVKVQQSLNEAQLIAVKNNHQQVDAMHFYKCRTCNAWTYRCEL